MQSDTILWIASCTKLMTGIAAMQCVERGLVGLDDDLSRIIPGVEKFGVLTGFDEKTGEAVLVPKKSAITLRNLMSHTSGYQYHLTSPLLTQWCTLRGEQPWQGETVEERATAPLVFQPGTSWSYGTGLDWVGKVVERLTGETLEIYMEKNIWGPLGVKDITFWPEERPDMPDRSAHLSTLDPSGGKSIPVPEGLGSSAGLKDCLGGEGLYSSSESFMLLLQAVLREDPSLLAPASWEEYFKPQLDETCAAALHEVAAAPENQDVQESAPNISYNIPNSGKKNFSFAGLLSQDEYPNWMGKDTLFWGGLPCCEWFVDRTTGICGFAGVQMFPPMNSLTMRLHEHFQKGVFAMAEAAKQKSG